MKALIAVALAVLGLTGCAVVPYGPPVASVGWGVNISGGSGHHHQNHHRGHRAQRGHHWR